MVNKLIELFVVSFVASALGSSIGVLVTLYFQKKQKEHLDKMKKSIQRTIRKIKEG